MASRFNAGARTTALSIAITLFATSLASAQSVNAAPSAAVPAATLLPKTAFERLAHVPQPDAAPSGVSEDTPRPSLLSQAKAAMSRQPQAAPAKPHERSWASRHKVALGVSIALGLIFGPFLIYAAMGGFE